MKSPEFIKNFARGRVAETAIERWLMERGNWVLPVYDVGEDANKGPQLFGHLEQLVAPDMLVFPKLAFVEAKSKSTFTWHRITGQWTTGIDRKHYQHYLKVQERTQIPVWLLFLHMQSRTSEIDLQWSCPATCPVGLFGESLTELKNCINHECGSRALSSGWGRSGMVYWAHKNLRLLADIEELSLTSSETDCLHVSSTMHSSAAIVSSNFTPLVLEAPF